MRVEWDTLKTRTEVRTIDNILHRLSHLTSTPAYREGKSMPSARMHISPAELDIYYITQGFPKHT